MRRFRPIQQLVVGRGRYVFFETLTGTTIAVVGVLAVLLLPTGGAHHRNDHGTGVTSWVAANGVLLLCESDDPAGGVVPGAGGLCFADSHTAGLGPPPGIGPASATTGWSQIDILDIAGSGTTLSHFARIANNANGIFVAGGQVFRYMELLAYWASEGHVTIFVDSSTGATSGGYSVGWPSGTWSAPTSSAVCNDLDDGEPVLDGDGVNEHSGTPVDNSNTVCADWP